MLTEVQVGSVSSVLLVKALLLQPGSFMLYWERLALMPSEGLHWAFEIAFFPRQGWRKDYCKARKSGEAIPAYVPLDSWKLSQ